MAKAYKNDFFLRTKMKMFDLLYFPDNFQIFLYYCFIKGFILF